MRRMLLSFRAPVPPSTAVSGPRGGEYEIRPYPPSRLAGLILPSRLAGAILPSRLAGTILASRPAEAIVSSRQAGTILPFRLAGAILVIALACLAWCALSRSAAFAGEEKPPAPEAARAVAELEARFAELLKEGTGFALRERYEALLGSASALAEKHAADPAVARAYWAIARCCEVLGKHPEKEAAFARYVEILVEHAKERAAAELKAEVEALVARREFFTAMKLLRLMLAKFPDGPEAAWALYRLGTCHLWMDHHEDAATALNEVIQRWPDTPIGIDARLRLARAQIAEGKAADAVAVLDAYLAGHPTAPQRDAMLFDLAVARVQSTDFYGAIVTFQQLIREVPGSPYVPVARAYIAKLRSDILSRIGREPRGGRE